ncbi:LptA/OstA family protein [Xanthobacter variabilis]|uniref:LptA/OstA family protein n=1 Tax=Xanthobacter variabilis TaxID=3119932 RepID=UPI003727A3E6
MTFSTRRAFATLMLAAMATAAGTTLASGPVLAQAQNVPNALQGFARNRDEPVRINADSLEVRDKDKVAVFSGNVVVVQGDTTLTSKDLQVYYDGSASPEDGAGFKQGQIRKLEAAGGVVVRTKDQTATGETGVFEMKSNTVTLTGKPVVLTQGPNVIRGQKLVVNLISGVSRFEGGRVESLIVPGSLKNQGAPGAAPGR